MAVFGIIGFDQAFAGFGNDTLMMVAGMLVIGQAVCETGVVDRMGGVWKGSRHWASDRLSPWFPWSRACFPRS